MRRPAGRNVEFEGRMLPVGSTWAGALAYSALAFLLLWIAVFLAREFIFILITGFFAAWALVYLLLTLRATLDARNFGAMGLRASALPATPGGRFLGSLRISESAAVKGTVRAELRCYQVWFDAQNERSEQTVWSGERSFPIRGESGGSYAIVEFPIPAGLPPSEPPPPTGGIEPGRRYSFWELQAIAESGGAYRDELYAVIVKPAAGAPAADDAALPIEIDRRAAPAAPAAAAAAAARPAAFEVSRRLPPKPPAPKPQAPKPRVPKPVEEAQDLAEPPVLPPAQPDRAALALLLAANLVPLAGVAFWGWKVQDVVFLYWLENLVIGGFNVLRILALQPAPKPGDEQPEGSLWPGRLALAGFFTVHYGGFCFGHGQFLVSFFGRAPGGEELSVAGMIARMLRDPVVAAALAAMIVSHGWSFFRNYLGRGEYQRADGGDLMTRPYKRIFVTHLFLILDGVLIEAIKAQLAAMLLFVVLKTGFDLHFHRREHRGQSGA